MSSECDEDEEYWYNKSSGDPGCEMGLEGVKLDPTQDAYLNWQTDIINVKKYFVSVTYSEIIGYQGQC